MLRPDSGLSPSPPSGISYTECVLQPPKGNPDQRYPEERRPEAGPHQAGPTLRMGGGTHRNLWPRAAVGRHGMMPQLGHQPAQPLPLHRPPRAQSPFLFTPIIQGNTCPE